MKSDVKRDIEKELKRYALKEIRIQEKKYPLYLVPELCDEDLNIFEGFLFVEAENKSEVSYLKTKYRPPVSGYTPRIGIILYDGHLLIKDYRRNKHIIKTIRKINKTFLNKLKKALSEPKEENLNKLFDRTDVIEEFYILYKKAREYLLKNISGIPEEEKREEFVDNFMMQMLTLWYLQERGFFNNDKNYFITKFKELKQKKLFNGFKSYYEFLTHLFEKISGNLDSQYYEDKITGKVVVVGPAVFLNGEHSKAISIPDKCFYKEDLTDILINTAPKKVSQEVPLLNLFESRDWTEGNIDEFVLGAIYEKLITYMERKKLGAYYTPEEITSYICENTIKPYLVDRINEKFRKKFETIDQIIESNDKEIILYIFEQLKEIKILDPAVGSAHFLESAINVLVSIYEKIWNKAKELGMRKGLEIIATDEKGEIKKINLLEIDDEDKFKLLVKFFIILSKNIYGVDVNPSALKVAKARLFLTLAKHFKVGKEKDIFIRFPNVHFNLREGNSLIGYVEIGREEEIKHKQPTLFDFGIREEEKIDYITEKIKVVEELKPYLEKTAKSLNLGGDVVKEVKELNKILAKRKINWNDFKKVLRTKEKLITILIASLNSKYAKPLNDLLREITDLFNQKLDEKFAEEHKIKLEDLKKIKTFHWIFEFPEVFLNRGGFDVVVGNPPYGNIFENKELQIIQKMFLFSSSLKDSSAIFIERSKELLLKKGKFGMIVPLNIARIEKFYNIRKFLIEKVSTYLILDTGNPFAGDVELEMIVIFYDFKKRDRFFVKSLKPVVSNKDGIPYSLIRKYDYRFILYWDKMYEYILGNSILSWLEVSQGVPRRADYTSTGKYLCISAQAIDRYTINVSKIQQERKVTENFVRKKKLMDQLEEALITPFSLGKTGKVTDLAFECIIKPKNYLPDGTTIFIKLKNDVITPKCALALLNSSLINYIACRYILSYGVRIFRNYIFHMLPLRLPSTQQPIIILADYMLFLNATEERRNREKELIDFIDKQIINSLVYELYFKEKFAKDGLYPEPKEYLLEAVSKHLKPINYDRWAELYWKKQLKGELTNEEEEELYTLEKGNLETIQEVYKSIKQDIEIKELIEKIKSHEWVRVIEGGN